MFFKKKKVYFKEERWCLGSHIEEAGNLLMPVFKISYEGRVKAPFLSHGRLIFQGLLHVTEGSNKWLGLENMSFKDVITNLPELKVYMNEEETHEH